LSLVMSSFVLSLIVLGPLALLIVLFLHIISGQHIPKEIYKEWQGHYCHKAKGIFLCYKRICLNMLTHNIYYYFLSRGLILSYIWFLYIDIMK
jgi:cytosine/uracil/thiamine/allantoin permease